jgi:hypothetical protein
MIRQLRSLGYRIEAPNPQPSQAEATVIFRGRVPGRTPPRIIIGHQHQIIGAFIARLAAWFPAEIAAINIQVLANGKTKKKAKKK